MEFRDGVAEDLREEFRTDPVADGLKVRVGVKFEELSPEKLELDAPVPHGGDLVN
jgi:hypothetical protein